MSTDADPGSPYLDRLSELIAANPVAHAMERYQWAIRAYDRSQGGSNEADEAERTQADLYAALETDEDRITDAVNTAVQTAVATAFDTYATRMAEGVRLTRREEISNLRDVSAGIGSGRYPIRSWAGFDPTQQG